MQRLEGGCGGSGGRTRVLVEPLKRAQGGRRRARRERACEHLAESEAGEGAEGARLHARDDMEVRLQRGWDRNIQQIGRFRKPI
jgi:hypothetical protein